MSRPASPPARWRPESSAGRRIDGSASRSDGRATPVGVTRTAVVRKVRAPQRRVAGNTRPSRDEDQCHSDDAVVDPRAGRRSETGKLHPEQGQIGGRNPCRATGRGRGALPSPRVGRMSRRATDGPRWMAITGRRPAPTGTELGLQTASLAERRGDGFAGLGLAPQPRGDGLAGLGLAPQPRGDGLAGLGLAPRCAGVRSPLRVLGP